MSELPRQSAGDPDDPTTTACPDPECDGTCAWDDDAGWECDTCGGQFGDGDDPEVLDG